MNSFFDMTVPCIGANCAFQIVGNALPNQWTTWTTGTTNFAFQNTVTFKCLFPISISLLFSGNTALQIQFINNNVMSQFGMQILSKDIVIGNFTSLEMFILFDNAAFDTLTFE